ncbi:hypothetical protein NQZ68_021783 [Dissostichus eleginoides]|nr:hypothetical protein NQZ68_021783 [Dissostichus eleginoides]
MSPIKENSASKFFTQVEKSVSSALVEDVLEMPGGTERPNTLERKEELNTKAGLSRGASRSSQKSEIELRVVFHHPEPPISHYP